MARGKIVEVKSILDCQKGRKNGHKRRRVA